MSSYLSVVLSLKAIFDIIALSSVAHMAVYIYFVSHLSH
ncbi:hypothetical protein CZ794_13170 [Psychrobacter sp. JB385]|nr:hypothetical protein CZ794_13170 [Psychrobacter sp. JB385]